MSFIELVEHLTSICIQQAEIIKTQAFALAQMGAVVEEEKIKTVSSELKIITSDTQREFS